MKPLVLFMLAVSAFAAPQGYRLQEPSGPGFSSGKVTPAVTGTSAQVGISSGAAVTGGAGLLTHVGHSVDGSSTTGAGVSAGIIGSTGSGLVSGHGALTGITTSTGAVGTVGTVPSVTTTGVTSITGLGSGAGLVAGGKFETECQEGEIRHIDGSCVVPEITRKVFVFDVPRQEQQPIESVTNLPLPKVDHNILFVRLPEGGVGPEPIIVPPPRQENIIYVLSKQGEESQRVIEVPAHPASEPEIYFVNYGEGENPTLPGGIDLETALGSASLTGGQFIENVGAIESGLGVSNVGIDNTGAGVVIPETGIQVGVGAPNSGVSPVTTVVDFGVNGGVAPGFEVVQTGGSQTGIGLAGTGGAPVSTGTLVSGLYTSP